MISSTGNKSHQRGYTFLELMLAVTILAAGITAIYKGLLTSLDYQTQLTCRLYAMNFMDHEIAVLERAFLPKGQVLAAENGKTQTAVLNYREVPFTVTFQVSPIDNLKGLQQADLVVTWPDREREIRLKRSVYLVSPYIKTSEPEAENVASSVVVP